MTAIIVLTTIIWVVIVVIAIYRPEKGADDK
jgi:hypothetical protein